METQNRFDLNTAMAKWSAELMAQESIGAVAMRELESHLREDIASWVQKGLSEREAFDIASGRLGPAERLGAEFQKENPTVMWRTRVFWIFAGVISTHFLSQIFGILSASWSIIAATIWQTTGADHWNPRFNSAASIAWFLFYLAMTAASPLLLYYGSKWFLVGGSGRLKRLEVFATSPARLAVSLVLLSFGLNLLNSVLEYYHQRILSPASSRQIMYLASALMYQIYPIALAILIARVAPERMFAKKAG